MINICTNSSWIPKLSSRASFPAGQAASAWAGEFGSVLEENGILSRGVRTWALLSCLIVSCLNGLLVLAEMCAALACGMACEHNTP